jgi:hypothetical protein
MTADITRLFPDRDTRFHALVRQQGRLPIDAEENFASDIAEWERDDAFTETIAPSGSPDDGFRVTLPVAAAPVSFTIGAGSYYLGGARIENPAALTYRGQRDRNWLGFPLDAEGAAEAIGAARRFLVWLDAWDQTVTATEDAELRDPGLGGADGAAARRFGWRVRATAVPGPDCVQARAQWLAAQGWTGLVDAGTGALRSGASLGVGFNPADVDQDLCAPALTPGFLGARNECYRVMTSRPGRYVWGRDDAAPVYRVRVEAISGQMRRIVFLTQPRDEHVRPRQGQTVELLRWDERLPNGQKTAEPVGRFLTVASGLSDGAITLTTAVDAATLAWLGALPAAMLSPEDAPGEQRYFYLRLWTGGGAGGQPDHPLAPGDLTGTGLRLSFAGTPLPGDAWVIAARPNAPTQLLPWAMRTGMPAHGPRRHVVPLAFVDLDAGTVIDCRRRFRPLYRLGGCCTVTVGDNQSSWGDVSTIAEAVARLPPSGGEICIGPGTWREAITLQGLRNITFTGCGPRSRWLAGADPAEPLVTLNRCEGIRFRRLAMESDAGPCLRAGADANRQGSRDLVLEDSTLATPSGGVVRVDGVERLTLDRCRVTSGPLADPLAGNAAFAALTLQGEALTVRHCLIRGQAGATAQALPLGGIHIGGQSRDIAITDSTITEGAGNGITLGSIRTIRIPAPAFTADPEAAVDEAVRAAGGALGLGGFIVTIDAAGCIRVEEQDPDPNEPGDGTVEVPVSDGALERIHIARNRIERCGANGIATYPLLPVNEKGQAAYDAIAIERVLIEDNAITDNLRREPAPIPVLQRLLSGIAGITLGFATDLTIRQNRIADNGVEPSRAASGVFVGFGEGVAITQNLIERNGALAGDLGASVGGIVVRMAIGGALPVVSFSAQTADPPALRVQGNTVHAPAGRALKAIAQGPVTVSDNRLTGANRSSLFANPLQAFILFLLGMQSAQDILASPDDPQVIDLLLYDAALDFLGGDAVSLVNLSFVDEFLLAFSINRLGNRLTTGAGANVTGSAKAAVGRFSAANFRGGETLFNDNQVALRGGPGDPAGHVSSVLIVSLDDVGCADNQIEIEADVALSLVDTILVGTTLRATGNRLQDSALCFASLVSFGFFMNTTAMNQGTFGIAAGCGVPAKLIDTPNLTIF